VNTDGASRLCDEAKPGQILISPRVLMKVENAVKVEPVGEFELKGMRRPLAAYNVVAANNVASTFPNTVEEDAAVFEPSTSSSSVMGDETRDGCHGVTYR
jgi:hypothetical protein